MDGFHGRAPCAFSRGNRRVDAPLSGPELRGGWGLLLCSENLTLHNVRLMAAWNGLIRRIRASRAARRIRRREMRIRKRTVSGGWANLRSGPERPLSRDGTTNTTAGMDTARRSHRSAGEDRCMNSGRNLARRAGSAACPNGTSRRRRQRIAVRASVRGSAYRDGRRESRGVAGCAGAAECSCGCPR